MQFTPRKPKEGINVSEEHPLIEAGTLIVGLSILFAIVTVILIYMVEIALYFIPVEKEAQIFDAWLPADITTVAPDDRRLARVESIVRQLSRHWPESPYDFRVEIDDSEMLNAMAFPGGLIIVTSGLLDKVESENELAFVLGHELGHFRNRDHMRGLGRGVVLGLVLAVISGSDGGAQLGASIADLALRGFSRRQESAADEFGLQLVQNEYGHVGDAWRFFEKLYEEEGGERLELLTYMSTHPSPDARIDDLIRMAGGNGWSIVGEIRPIEW